MVETHDSQPMNELTPGKLLLQGRLQAGLTQEQVAKELYMIVSKVEALETDDYSRLKSDTFARGYIRAYANLVKVDVVLALAAYDKLLDNVKPAQVEQPAVTTAQHGPRGAWQFLAVIGAFFIALWLISVWFFDNHTETQYILPVESTLALGSVSNLSTAASSANVLPTDSSSVAPSSPVLAANSSAIELNQDGKQILNSESVSSMKSASFASASSSAVTSKATFVDGESSIASATHTATSSSSKKTSLDEVNFSFRAESWLEVSDSRGDVLATELQPAGSEVKLVGRAPFDVKLGNARAVDIELNGKKMDVTPSSGSNVLILKIEN